MRLRRALWAASLALLASFLLGPSCGSGGGPDAPVAALDLEVIGPFPLSDDRHILQLFVVVDSGVSFQAVDLDLRWTPAGSVSLAFGVPEMAFDDDGRLFGTADFDPVAGALSHVADLRHGAGADVSGPIRVASVVIIADGSADVSFDVAGDVARPDGILFDTTPGQTVVSFPDSNP